MPTCSRVSLSLYLPPGLLFHRAIMMSGSGLAPWSLVGEPAKFAAYVSHHVNCSPDLPHQLLLKCLRDKPLEDILSTSVRAPDFGNAFGPSVDGVVIGRCPVLELHTASQPKWDCLLGKRMDFLSTKPVIKSRFMPNVQIRERYSRWTGRTTVTTVAIRLQRNHPLISTTRSTPSTRYCCAN